MSDALVKFLKDEFMPVFKRQVSAVEYLKKYFKLTLTEEQLEALKAIEHPNKVLAQIKVEAGQELGRAVNTARRKIEVAKSADIKKREKERLQDKMAQGPSGESPLPEVDADEFLKGAAEEEAYGEPEEKAYGEPEEATPVVEEPVTIEDVRAALTSLAKKDGNKKRALAILSEKGDKAEGLPGSEPVIKGGVKGLEEKYFRAVRDAIVAVRDAK